MVRENIPLTIIIVAALLLEVTSGVMYYSAQRIIHRTVEKLIDREMNALFLCIRTKLARVEVTAGETVPRASWSSVLLRLARVLFLGGE